MQYSTDRESGVLCVSNGRCFHKETAAPLNLISLLKKLIFWRLCGDYWHNLENKEFTSIICIIIRRQCWWMMSFGIVATRKIGH